MRMPQIRRMTRVAFAGALTMVLGLGINGCAAPPAQVSQTKADRPTMRFVQTNGIKMRIAEMGSGPLVVLLHGWPESWYSWRHQLPALANAGFRVVAPDMRGFGKTDAPTAVAVMAHASGPYYYVDEFRQAGFRGGINYYRNIDRNWQTTAQLADAQIALPVLFVAGEKDLVLRGATAEQLTATMGKFVTDLRGVTLYPGVGHWVQQERPDEVNKAVVEFLKSLPKS